MLDADLLAFLRHSVRSTWALEMLLLLRKRAPQRLTVPDLVRELRATRSLISSCVAQLSEAGLIVCDGEEGCAYRPVDAALAASCEKLARTYEERPVAVINAILAAPHERLKSFAEAFRFGKKKDE